MDGHQYPKLLTKSTSVSCRWLTTRVTRRLRTFLGAFDTDYHLSLYDFESNWDTLDGGAFRAFAEIGPSVIFYLTCRIDLYDYKNADLLYR